MKEVIKIKKIRFNDDFTIDAVFENGEAKRYNALPYIGKVPMFKCLLEIELFKKPREITESAIHWNDKADITWDWLYEDGVEINPF